MQNDLSRTFQIASLGEIPSSLRFIYASLKNDVYRFHACFSDEATDDEMECASRISAEIIASFDRVAEIHMEEKIERRSELPWKIEDGRDLLYLRYGELEGIP